MNHKNLLVLLVIGAFQIANGGSVQQIFQLEEYLDNGLLPLIAKAVENEKDTKSLQKCARDILLWKDSLTSEFWAAKMLDSSGKFSSGLLIGNIYSLGEFKECLSITKYETKADFAGKYCPIAFSINNILEGIINITSDPFSLAETPQPRIMDNMVDIGGIGIPLVFGTCIPDSCNIKEISQYLIQALTSLGLNFTKPLMAMEERMCSTTSTEYNDREIAAIVFFSFIALLIVLSTAYELVITFIIKAKPKCHDLLIIFSLYNNTIKLTKINRGGTSLRCLHGIRVLSMAWVILGHRFSNTAGFPVENILLANEFTKRLSSMFIMGANVSVDTFYLLSGFLVAFVTSNHIEKKNSFNVGLYYIHRFLRIWPAMAAFVFLFSTILGRLNSGPVWPIVAFTREDICQDDWWSTILYIQNYVHPSGMCVGHFWYLAVDTQLYILSPILLIPLWKWPKFGRFNLAFWLLVSQITTAAVIFTNNWAGAGEGDEKFWIQYYSATHTRAIVWMVGFTAGYLIYLTKGERISINKWVNTLGWLISIAILFAVVLGIKPFLEENHQVTPLHDGSFSAFARTAWALSIVWIIFSCVNGYGGPINWFLSSRMFEILGKLSYSMYITHILVQIVVSGPTRVVIHFRELVVIYEYFGDLVVTLVISYLWAMAFESPFMALERILFNQ